MAAISTSSAASTFSRSSGSVLDGRRLNHQVSPRTVSPSSSSVVTPGCDAYTSLTRCGGAAPGRSTSLLISPLAAYLENSARMRRQRPVVVAERGEGVQRGEHARVSEPEVPEVEVARVLAAEDGLGLRHLRLDERVADPGPDRGAAVLADDLGDRPRGDQVVDDGGARLPGQLAGRDQRGEHRRAHDLAALVDDEAAVGVAVEGQADVGAGAP